jgi:hypothetical protein
MEWITNVNINAISATILFILVFIGMLLVIVVPVSLMTQSDRTRSELLLKINVTNKRKKLTFVFSMLSLVGFGYSILKWDERAFSSRFDDMLVIWFWFSVPLVIQIIYNIIFREGDT